MLSPFSLAQTAPTPLSQEDEARIEELVIANRILANEGIVDGFGHISVRSATNPTHYFMAGSRAPALVQRDDIIEFDENGAPLNARPGQELYSERFIHGEIYRVRPDAQSVVHAHSPAVLPFGLTNTPLLPVIHNAAFLGTEPAPVFEIWDAGGEDNAMLVSTLELGAALATQLGNRPVILMRGHGMAVAAESIQRAVFQAVYTQRNASILLEALRLGPPIYLNRYEVQRTDRMDRQWEKWRRDAEASLRQDAP
ncbi:MAG: class II aldolase/adducin family protein [Pseudomonadales bacterium]|nr:class II aldolase/adducin family protein [Pseudomonadales bacterium]